MKPSSISAVAAVALFCLLGGTACAEIPLNAAKQLFLDDSVIAEKHNVQRVIHSAQKYTDNPVLRATETWEGPVSIVYGSVLRDQERFRCWYLTYEKDGTKAVAYAESDDGIRWQKPRLDFHRTDGDSTNVLIRVGADANAPNAMPDFLELFGVHKDPTDPDPSRRYKMGFLSLQRDYQGPQEDPFHRGQRRGLGVAASADGLRWQLIDSWTTDAICDGATHWMFDKAHARYVLYGRTKLRAPELLKAWKANDWVSRYYWGRVVARVESPDFVHWDHKAPASAPVVLAPDAEDSPGTEIYSMNVFPYESVYIGLVQVFHNQPDSCQLDIQLAVSHDSVHFERVGDRSPFIAVGGVGDWDRFNISLANNPPIAAAEGLRFYYGGRNQRHSPYQGSDKGERFGGIGFATIRPDRFVSLQSSFEGGTILTKPLTMVGEALYLNAKSDFGSVVVEVLSGDRSVVAKSESIQVDATRIPVRWQDGTWKRTARPVQLRITLKNAHLFAFWCE